jgi:hypothetical protein
MEATYEAMATYPGLWDVWEEVADMYVPSDFDGFGFSEIWLMDDGMKYTSRRDPRAPADFFCFAPSPQGGFWELERKRRPLTGTSMPAIRRACRSACAGIARARNARNLSREPVAAPNLR